MTLLAVSIMVQAPAEVPDATRRAERAVREGARLVEWRIDRLATADGGVEAAAALLAASPAPAIATCRGAAEGGVFDGDETQRAALYEAVIGAATPPRFVDVELSAWRASPQLRQRITAALDRAGRGQVPSLILSTHDFQGRPPDLLQRVESMAAEPACAAIKVAWQARSLRDNLEALEVLAARHKPTIALCMGRFGLMSRVLAPKHGALLVYAAAGTGRETAPGQPTVRELIDTYRFQRVGPDTRVYGVIGWPVEHSPGPRVHNAGFEAAGFDGVYLPLPVPPEYVHFKATVGSLLDDRRLGLRGASVTLPHKENLLRFVTERGGAVDPPAARIGAANTLTVEADGAIRCSNTDAAGAAGALLAALGRPPTGPLDAAVAVLGAGGVARAVSAALGDLGAAVTMFARSPDRAEAVAAELNERAGGKSPPIGAAALSSLAAGFDVLVNCTPVGMAGGPAPDESPLPPGYRLDASTVVFETVHTPVDTPLVRAAESAGARVIRGAELFFRQAALQFEQWTGKPTDFEHPSPAES